MVGLEEIRHEIRKVSMVKQSLHDIMDFSWNLNHMKFQSMNY